MAIVVRRSRVRWQLVGISLLTLVSILLAGCGASAEGGQSSKPLSPITLGLTYVPNIQFAPFYVAAKLGYYKNVGLNVTFHHHNAGEDEFSAILAGKEDAIFAGGDETAQARAKSAPLVYVAEVFREYPVALIVPQSSTIHTLSDLRGHTIGIPGPYGATYIGLLALLRSAGVAPSDVHIRSIGYTQVPALVAHKVDAIMGYVNNEPLALKQAGVATRVFTVASVQPLVSDGLVATSTTLKQHPATIKALIAATLRGVQYTIAHPQQAVAISKSYVPNLDSASSSQQALNTLQATIPLMRPGKAQAGYTNPSDWTSMVTFLESIKQLPAGFKTSAAYTNQYLPNG